MLAGGGNPAELSPGGASTAGGMAHLCWGVNAVVAFGEEKEV